MSTDGHDNRGPEMAIISIAITACSVIAVSLRCYTMTTILKRFLIEDWLAVVTCLLQCAFCTFVLLGISHGLGAHVVDIAEDERPKALLWKWAGQVAYIVVSTMVKFVVGIFLLRLCLNNGWQRITIWVLLVLVGVYNTFYVFIAIFQCQPVPFYWWRYATNAPITGKCNGKALATIPTYIAVLLGLAGDLILALLPITLVKNAKLDRRTKISVVCVLALGSMASVATVARIPYAKQLLSNPDYLYNFTDLAIWSIVECGIAITASSLATLRPLFVKMKVIAQSNFTSRFGSSMNTSGLPTFNTKISSTGMTSRTRDTKMTGMTGFTSGSNLTSVVEKDESSGGITVDRQFEMSFITRETSKDSIDALEAEINEVIRPGTSKGLSGRNFREKSRADSSGHERRLSYKAMQVPASPGLYDLPQRPSSRSTFTSISGPSSPALNPPAHIAQTLLPKSSAPSVRSIGSIRRKIANKPPRLMTQSSATFGSAHSDGSSIASIIPPPPVRGHQSTNSDGSIKSPRTPGSPTPGFHLPTRMAHQSMASVATASTSQSAATTGSLGWVTKTKLPPPPRLVHTSHGTCTPPNKAASRSRSTSRPTTANSHGGVRFPFESFAEEPANEFIFENFGKHSNFQDSGSKPSKKTMRTSGFLADESDGESHDKQQRGRVLLPADKPPSPTRPNPLRSNPPMPQQGNWM